MKCAPAIEYQTLACNAILVSICFFLLPQTLRDWLFSEFHGSQTFVTILVSWMISDVISTNLLGHDPEHALLALDEPGGIARFIRIKALALALCTGALGFAVSLYLGISHHEMWRTLTLIPICFGMPLVTVCLGSIVGVLAPYRLRTAQWRWQNRGRKWVNIRWLILVFAPAGALGSVNTLLLLPLRLFSEPHVPGQRMSFMDSLTLPGIVSLEVSVIYLLVPLCVQYLASRRREKLRAYLTSETAG